MLILFGKNIPYKCGNSSKEGGLKVEKPKYMFMLYYQNAG
jgi:hypothetical protein